VVVRVSPAGELEMLGMLGGLLEGSDLEVFRK